MHVRHIFPSIARRGYDWLAIACYIVALWRWWNVYKLPSHDARLSFGRERNALSNCWWSSLIRRVSITGTRCSDKRISVPSSASVSVTLMGVIDVTESSVISEPNQLDVFCVHVFKLRISKIYVYGYTRSFGVRMSCKPKFVCSSGSKIYYTYRRRTSWIINEYMKTKREFLEGLMAHMI